MAVYYDSAAIYIQSCKSIKDKITAIDAIIDALLLTAARAAAGDNISEYSLNDGQTIIKTVYKSSSSIQSSIMEFEKLKNFYAQRLNGGIIRLVDSKNFIGRSNGR